MQDMILFSQAPADIMHVLALYEKHHQQHKITIIVVNVQNNYKFFDSLDLGIQIEFIPLVSQTKPVQFLKLIFGLKSQYRHLFAHSNDAIVYYFSNNYDYITAYFIENLSKTNQINFIDLYQIDGPAIHSTSAKLKTAIMSAILGVKFKFFQHMENVIYQYQLPDRDNCAQIPVPHISKGQLARFEYEVKNSDDQPSLLLMESNGANDPRFQHYNNDLRQIFEQISPQYSIYIKPHPRIGASDMISHYQTTMIEAYVPAELINLDGFSVILGIDSTAIATIEHQHKYCLLELFEFVDIEVKHHLRDYLNKLADKPIEYIDNVAELKSIG